MNWTLKRKLLAGSIAVSALLAALSVFSIMRLSAINEDLTKVGKTSMPAVEQAGKIETALNRLRTLEMRLILESNETDRVEIMNSMGQTIAAMKNSQSEYERVITSTEAKQAYENAKVALADYLQKHEQFVNLDRQKQKAEAQHWLLTEAKRSFDQCTAAMETVEKRNSDDVAEVLKAGADTFNSGRLTLIGLSLVTGILSLFIGWWTARYVSRNVSIVADRVAQLKGLCITNLGKAMDALSHGDLKFEIMTGTPEFDVKGNDEISALQESINGIIQQTKNTVAAFEKSRVLMLGLIDETTELTKAAANGKLETRADGNKFDGSFKELLTGINTLLDTIVDRITVVSQRVEQLRGLCVTNLGRATDAMANGDLKFEIVTGTEFLDTNSNDALGKLGESVNGIIKQTQGTVASFEKSRTTILNVIEETNRLAGAARVGDLEARANANNYKGNYAELLTGINNLVEGIAKPLSEIGEVINQMAQQNMAARANGDYKGEYDTLKRNVNRAAEALDQALTQVGEAAEQVSTASNQISAGSQALAKGASEQASSLEEVAGSLQELASMTKQNTGNAKEARSLTEGARASAELGVENMVRLSEAINQIKASSDATAKIVKTIDEIAFQTNLLALNAAVEAARAGDAGKGFAVVAEEVRNLAMRSAEAAKNTANLIEESVKNATTGVTLNENVDKNLKEINEQVRKVTEMMAEIAAASDQQSHGVDQINVAVEQMNQVTQQTAANAEESAATAEELTGQSETLLSMVNSFQLTDKSRKSLSRPSVSNMNSVLSAPSRKRTNGNGHTVNASDPRKLIPFDEDMEVLRDF